MCKITWAHKCNPNYANHGFSFPSCQNAGQLNDEDTELILNDGGGLMYSDMTVSTDAHGVSTSQTGLYSLAGTSDDPLDRELAFGGTRLVLPTDEPPDPLTSFPPPPPSPPLSDPLRHRVWACQTAANLGLYVTLSFTDIKLNDYLCFYWFIILCHI